jgi:adenylate cyclase
VVDTTGDNLLAEFTSAVDAVNCSVEIQRELAERNTELPYERKMEFRIGVNVGDVVEEDDRIYGDGVNIAARVEGFAEAGGICISGRVYDQVENKLDLEFEYLGEKEVKNITRPIRVYRVLSYPGAAAHRVVKAKDAVRKKWRKIVLATAAVLVAAIAIATIWNFYLRPPPVKVASVEKMAHPLPDNPSIVVLPFDNLSKDPDQDYIVDGITDQIITGLSMSPHMFVIARESSFSYKNKDVEIRQISEELGVQYVLEGSVQVSGNRIRITAQLIDALSGHHIWSERYDRELEDIFALQDEIMVKIMQAMHLEVAGLAILDDQPAPPSVEAYKKMLKAIVYVYRFDKNDMAQGRKLYEEAIALYPEYGPAYRLLAWTHFHDYMFGYSKSPAESLNKAEEQANQAVSLGDDKAYSLLSYIYLRKGQFEKAITIGEKGLANNSNWAQYPALFSWILTFVGRDNEAISLIQKAIRLNPKSPFWYFGYASIYYFNTGRYEEALEASKQCVQINRAFIYGWISLSASYSLLGRDEIAHETTKEMLKIFPAVSMKNMPFLLPYKNPARQKLWFDALRKAGIPENPPLKLPDKPSIAVLPFDNISGDPEQEYFSDGMTDDLITDLSKISGLFVIARNSSFKYKGQSVDVKKVSRELGVRYVLEGSVRKAENKLRINAQLIDATTGGHLWAERYDRDYKDIFALQDEIVQHIVSALAVKLTQGEKNQLARKYTDNLEAYDYYLRGEQSLHSFSGEGVDKAKSMFEKAIDLDSKFAHAYAAHAMAHYYIWRLFFTGGGTAPADAREQAFESVTKALALDGRLPRAHLVLAGLYLVDRRYEEAIESAAKAVALDPNNADSYVMQSYVLTKAGSHEEALKAINTAFRLNPKPPPHYYLYQSEVRFNLRQYADVVESIKMTGNTFTEEWLSGWLAPSYAYLGRIEEARKEIQKLRTLRPQANLSWIEQTNILKLEEDTKHAVEGFRRAGLRSYTELEKGTEKKLSGEEIRAIAVDRTWTGFVQGKEDSWWFHFNQDGKMPTWGALGDDNASYWIDGDRICWQWRKLNINEVCCFIHRNPEGKAEEKNEYKGVCNAGLWPFSVEK